MTELNDHSSRAHALLSASSAHRWMACPASARLAAGYPSQDTVFTREGTLAHEIAEAVVKGEAVKDIDNPEGFDVLAMVKHAEEYRDYIAGLMDPTSVLMLEQRLDFSPWVPDGFGTADCIIMTGDVMDVIDFKYGAGVSVDAVNNPQMQLYGLGALNEYGFVYDIERVRLHIFQPRKDNISVFELTRAELEQFGTVAAVAAEEALGDHPLQASGPHCKFCPHAGRCMALTLDCLSNVSDGTSIPSGDTLTAEGRARVLQLEPVITAWLKKVKEQALTDALNGENVPGFKVVEGKLGNRSWTDELQVMAALDAAGIAREDYTTLQLLSPAAMDKALGKKRAKELLEGYISRSPGAPTLVPENDKRPKLDRVAQAADDFKE